MAEWLTNSPGANLDRGATRRARGRTPRVNALSQSADQMENLQGGWCGLTFSKNTASAEAPLPTALNEVVPELAQEKTGSERWLSG